MPGERVLVVDDELEIRELIAMHLKKEGMIVSKADCGQRALLMIAACDYSLIVLDIMLPDMDGFEVLKEIRKSKPLLPVIFLSSRHEDCDKVLGFGLGADDYVTKPFSSKELMARVKSHIKRSNNFREPIKALEMIKRGRLIMDMKSYTLTKDNRLIELSAIEFKLMKFFMDYPERVFTKAQIYKHVWEDSFEDNNSVMVYISHLRDKIEDNPKEPYFIQTVRGIGYKFVVLE